MKKMVAVLSAFLLSSTLYSADSDNGLSGAYVGVGLAIEAVPKHADEYGVGLVLKGGMALPQLFEGLGAEVELTKSLSDPEDGAGHGVSILTLAGYVTYDITIPDSPFSVRPRAGIILPNLGDNESVNSRDFGFSLGVAGVYALNEQLNAYVDYTVLGEYITNYTAGIELKF